MSTRNWNDVSSKLQGIERYNPQNIPILEEYVQYQLAKKTYNLDANLALLKLYQFNPNHFQTLITAHVLLKALTNLPHPDFVLCKCLIDHSKLEEEELLRKIVELSDLLERCQFRDFWNQLRNEKDLFFTNVVSPVAGFEEGIIDFIVHIVSKTYQTIHYDEMKEILGGLSHEEIGKLIKTKGWKKLDDNYLVVANHEENIKTKNIVEKIKFSDVSSVMLSAVKP